MSDRDCGDGFICPTATGLCMEACLLESDCAYGLSCNALLGACAECTFDPDCDEAPRARCLTDEGRCVECLAAPHCAPEYFCDLMETSRTRYSCQPGCLDAGDCALGNQCERHGDAPGRCVECSTETALQDCRDGARQRCHPDLRKCVQCFEHELHCNVGLLRFCHQEDWVCVQCLQHEHCPKGMICAEDTSRCESGCSDDDRCPPMGQHSLLYCDAWRGSQGECVECLDDSHCELGYRCRDGSCTEGCNGDHHCPSHKRRCDLIEDKCVECLVDVDCGPDLSCDIHEKACSCLVQGNHCSASSECGNPLNWPDPFWTGECRTQVWCASEVKCLSTEATPWKSLDPPRCADPCSTPDFRDDCPSTHCCRRVRNTENQEGLKCVPNNQCSTSCW